MVSFLKRRNARTGIQASPLGIYCDETAVYVVQVLDATTAPPTFIKVSAAHKGNPASAIADLLDEHSIAQREAVMAISVKDAALGTMADLAKMRLTDRHAFVATNFEDDEQRFTSNGMELPESDRAIALGPELSDSSQAYGVTMRVIIERLARIASAAGLQLRGLIAEPEAWRAAVGAEADALVRNDFNGVAVSVLGEHPIGRIFPVDFSRDWIPALKVYFQSLLSQSNHALDVQRVYLLDQTASEKGGVRDDDLRADLESNLNVKLVKFLAARDPEGGGALDSSPIWLIAYGCAVANLADAVNFATGTSRKTIAGFFESSRERLVTYAVAVGIAAVIGLLSYGMVAYWVNDLSGQSVVLTLKQNALDRERARDEAQLGGSFGDLEPLIPYFSATRNSGVDERNAIVAVGNLGVPDHLWITDIIADAAATPRVTSVAVAYASLGDLSSFEQLLSGMDFVPSTDGATPKHSADAYYATVISLVPPTPAPVVVAPDAGPSVKTTSLPSLVQ